MTTELLTFHSLAFYCCNLSVWGQVSPNTLPSVSWVVYAESRLFQNSVLMQFGFMTIPEH